MRSVLFNVFEILINIFEGFVLMYFEYSYLGDKRNRTFLKSPGAFFAIILAFTISVMNYFTVFEHFYALIYIAILLTYVCICLNGSIIKKMFSVAFSSAVMSISVTFVGNFSAVLLGTDLYSILSEKNAERLISVTAAHMVFLYCMIVSLKMLKRNDENNGEPAVSEWILIIAVFAISIAAGAMLNFVSIDPSSRRGKKYIAAVFLCIILINVAVCCLIMDLGKKNKAVRENEILKLEKEYSSQYLANADIEYDIIRKLRHDSKENYMTIYTLISEGKTENAVKYIEDTLGIISETETFIKTNNDIVNAVVNAKLTAAKSYGIRVTYMSVADFKGIDDSDLCRLLSNMLENAVTACRECSREPKHIYLNISADEYKYDFIIKNTVGGSVLSDNPELISTKKNKSEHGYGTGIIRDIAKKYKGSADFYEENGDFCCHVILRQYRTKSD